MGLQIPPGSPVPSCPDGFSGEVEPPISGADPPRLTCVVEVPSPLVVVGLLGKHGLGDELFRLVVEVVVEIVPQQQVQQRGLPVGVVAQRGRPQPGVQEAAGKGERVLRRRKAAAPLPGARGTELGASPHAGATLPPDHVELIQELVDAGVVVVTFCHHQVEGAAVLGADLLHQVVRHFLSLREGDGGQSRGTAARGERRG